jgi:hypothetical protein
MRSSEPTGSQPVDGTASLEVATPLGVARLSILGPDVEPVGTLVLGHGAGGGVEAVDLVAVARAARDDGWRVVLVEQPWRVAGRRVAPSPASLDRAWTAALAELAPGGALGPAGPLILGGRSAGARVACRTAVGLGAAGVVCLAFPLHPPGRPERSRLGELTGAGVPALVVQGRRDAFGRPPELSSALAKGLPVEVVAVDGDHALKVDPDAVAHAVRTWLAARVR